MEEVACSLPGSPQSYEQGTLRRSSTLTSDKDKSSEKDDLKSTSSKISRRLSNVSTATMTHVRTSSEIGSKSDPVKYPNFFSEHDLHHQNENTLLVIHLTRHVLL